ncbi:MAG: radical SAM protein [Elusimicrobiota bacterium]
MNADYTADVVVAEIAPAIYIHIPFCRKKCNYCDFVSADYADKTTDYADKYLKILAEEFSSRLSSILYPLPSTLYIGGGTPSILSEKQLSFLFRTILAHLAKCATEITFELNPESVTAEKLKLLKDFGVNRLSIGLQTFDNRLLKFLGRVHTAKDFLNCYAITRAIGFNNINIDLFFVIPGQKF